MTRRRTSARPLRLPRLEPRAVRRGRRRGLLVPSCLRGVASTSRAALLAPRCATTPVPAVALPAVTIATEKKPSPTAATSDRPNAQHRVPAAGARGTGPSMRNVGNGSRSIRVPADRRGPGRSLRALPISPPPSAGYCALTASRLRRLVDSLRRQPEPAGAEAEGRESGTPSPARPAAPAAKTRLPARG